jgi:hypothetical protein
MRHILLSCLVPSRLDLSLNLSAWGGGGLFWPSAYEPLIFLHNFTYTKVAHIMLIACWREFVSVWCSSWCTAAVCMLIGNTRASFLLDHLRHAQTQAWRNHQQQSSTTPNTFGKHLENLQKKMNEKTLLVNVAP